MDEQIKEYCIIKLMFPVTSDEQAFDCKKKVQAMLSAIPNSRVDFRIIAGELLTPPNQNELTG